MPDEVGDPDVGERVDRPSRGALRKQRASAAGRPAGSAPSMAADESTPGNAVAVEEDEAFPVRLPSREVPDAGESESLVGLPDVPKASAGWIVLERLDDGPGRFAGTVVGDEHLEVVVILSSKALQHQLQRVGASIGRHDHRAAGRHLGGSVRSTRRVGGTSGSRRLRWAFANL